MGGNLFIRGAVSVAHTFGMSDRLVGLTVVAAGTSLPELVTGVIAARRGHSDLVIGNVIGSNVFNILLCLEGAALVGPVGGPPGPLAVDFTALFVMTALMAVLIRGERVISRVEGAIALALYVAFVVVTVVKG